MKFNIYLKKNEERRLKSGHLWIFSNEIGRIESADNGDSSAHPENGDMVSVYDSRSAFIGTAFYNKNSLIAGRLLSNVPIEDTEAFFRQRMEDALQLRGNFYPERNSFRFIFSESDRLPGLIIDKYNNSYVLQIYSAGMQKNIQIIVNILKDDYGAENIFTRNEPYFRKMEGLPEEDEIYLGEIRSELISDGKIEYRIDFTGHKTGFYFDQNDNRFFIEKLCAGKRVLDAFCNSGGFGLHAAAAGAASVTFLDSSKSEIENAKQNFKLNGLTSGEEYVTADVFDFLGGTEEVYDVTMIDPPAFAKNKKSLPQAIKGYEKLNRLAMGRTAPGGFLVTSSCSHHLDKAEFIKILNTAAAKAGRQIQLLKYNGASLDHPEIPAMPETSYLKFAVLRVL